MWIKLILFRLSRWMRIAHAHFHYANGKHTSLEHNGVKQTHVEKNVFPFAFLIWLQRRKRKTKIGSQTTKKLLSFRWASCGAHLGQTNFYYVSHSLSQAERCLRSTLISRISVLIFNYSWEPNWASCDFGMGNWSTLCWRRCVVTEFGSR